MNRLVGVYSLLLLAALVGAFLSWTREPEEKQNSAVVLFDAVQADLARVEFESERLVASIETMSDDRGGYLWVRTEKRSGSASGGKDKPSASAQSAPTTAGDSDKAQKERDGAPSNNEGLEPGQDGAPEKPTPEKTSANTDAQAASAIPKSFKAGDAGQRVIEHFAPFRALRRLESIDADKLDGFGLKTPEATLKLVTRSGVEATFEVGSDGYGHRHIYVRDPRTGHVYLVDGGSIRPLRHADTRLPDRELVDLKEKDVTGVVVRSEKGRAALEQHNRADRSAAFWSSVGTDTPNESAKSWLAKVFRLRGTEYVQEGDVPTALQPAFSVDMEAENRPVLRLELVSHNGKDGELTWYARSEHTRGLVKINGSAAASLHADTESILSQDQMEAKEAE
jgi:hypothetical protein